MSDISDVSNDHNESLPIEGDLSQTEELFQADITAVESSLSEGKSNMYIFRCEYASLII